VGLELGWKLGGGPDRETARAVAVLCAAHPGPAPVYVAWSDGNGSAARLRARRLRVELTEQLLDALRKLLGTERVRLTRAR
jgi:hypothetical protein